jgi:hypothetical protein
MLRKASGKNDQSAVSKKTLTVIETEDESKNGPGTVGGQGSYLHKLVTF